MIFYGRRLAADIWLGLKLPIEEFSYGSETDIDIARGGRSGLRRSASRPAAKPIARTIAGNAE